jgi:Uma2 family endonuclease
VRTFSGFDPLVELYGLWTTELAERYLPIPGMPPVKYECLDGHLIMSPRGNSSNSYAAVKLGALLRTEARRHGALACTSACVLFNPQRWIEPDVVVLGKPVKQVDWVPVDHVLMLVEFVSRLSVRRDRIDAPTLCAAGVPYFMTVEISRYDVHVELLRLDDSGEYVIQAKALTGQEFRTELPFPLSFDPTELLCPEQINR